MSSSISHLHSVRLRPRLAALRSLARALAGVEVARGFDAGERSAGSEADHSCRELVQCGNIEFHIVTSLRPSGASGGVARQLRYGATGDQASKQRRRSI
jgi:hypothetical protein